MNAHEHTTLFDEAEETAEIIDTITNSPRVTEVKLEDKIIAVQDLFPMNAFFQPYELFWKTCAICSLSSLVYRNPF